jgi:signal transduction histidine kinase
MQSEDVVDQEKSAGPTLLQDASVQRRRGALTARLAWALAAVLLPALVLVGVAVAEHRTLAGLIRANDRVVAFADAVQEARRHEKNELLGHDVLAAAAWRQEVASAVALADDPMVAAQDPGLAGLARAYADSQPEGRREAGHALSLAVARIAQAHQQAQLVGLDRIGLLLGIALAGCLLALVLGAMLLVRRVLLPLRRIEERIHRLGEGDFAPIGGPPGDRAVEAVRQALDRTVERIRLRETLLVQSERRAAMGTLVFSVAHELGNPLGNIALAQGSLAGEWRRLEPAQVDAALAEIAGEVVRARGIIRSVLDFVRPGEARQFDLAEAVAETLRLVRADLPRDARIAVDIPPGLQLHADRGQAQQALINLLRNAAAAIAPTGHIRIAAIRAGGRVLLSVEDDGQGVEPGLAARLGEPFLTTRPAGQGHGLGLWIVHRIAAAHAGEVAISSRPGSGTTVTIAFGSQP